MHACTTGENADGPDTCMCDLKTEENLVLKNSVDERDYQQHIGSERAVARIPSLYPQSIAMHLHHHTVR